ncbi:MAG: NifB/NifX family molybdenum-iron cluster-binding protein [Bacteroidales bacterium]|nr:NifB/NifX family molybdenum-iron cluster-binding protein [Bacteroidales bacterium]MCF8457988.1 NifB/NifX family molybdenum-iron cluster-binding protein [Bacteroidales bacterium]
MNPNQKFAIPTLNQGLTAHFGHCEKFAILDVVDNKVVNEEYVTPPVHQPGVYPKYLADLGVNIIIAGGMGVKAQNLFAENNIQVYMGVQEGLPKQLVEDYLNNQLKTGMNLCDH